VRILVDCDVLLDVALKREPFLQASLEVLKWAADEPGQAAVAWHSLSSVAYILKPDATLFIRDLLEYLEVAPVGTREARQATSFPMKDFEDALQAACALAFDALYIVTRNLAHFRKSPIPALSPAQFLQEVGRV